MFYFGIDWSQAYHHLCILNEAGARVSHIKFEHSPTGFAKIEHERCNLKVPASECLVGIETSYNSVVDFLLDRNYPVHIVPPRATNGYRNRQRGSGAYDDDSDAALLASIMRTDRDSHPRLRRNTALTQQILAQVRLIESLRVSIQRQSNQLRAVLQRTYPEALGLFGDLTAQITLQFLMAYPTAAEASALSRDAFEAFCRQQGYTRTDLIPRRYAHLVAAAPSADPTVVRAHRYQVRILAQVLLPQVRCRTQALAGLGHLFEQHPDAFIFAYLPGAGPLLAPALLAKFGDHRDRFPAPESVQAQAGTCPVTERSGKRKKRVKFLLQEGTCPVLTSTGLSLSPPSHTRSPIGSPCGLLSHPVHCPAGGLWAYHVPRSNHRMG